MNAPHDGQRFLNADPEQRAHGLGAVLRWKLSSRAAKWPRWVENPAPAARPRLRPDEIRVTFINHATLLIESPVGNLLTDPVFSERTSPLSWIGPRRVRAPGLALEALPPIHGILLSHDHYDHLDVPSLKALHQRWQPWVATPLGVGHRLRRLGLQAIDELDWWQGTERNGIAVTCTPAQHFSGRGLFDRNQTLWGGLSVRVAGQHLYFAGDTGYGAFFSQIRERLGAPDLSLLPIGAYAPRWFMKPVHMDPQDAIRAHQDLDSRRSLGIHWGTWQLTDEALEEPLERLAQARAEAGLAPGSFTVLPHGGSFTLSPQAAEVAS